MSNLSIEQLSSLIRAIDTQILAEQAMIARDQSDIAILENQIGKRPDGLQAQYDVADFVYISTLNEYNKQVKILGFNQSTLSTKLGELSSLSTLSRQMESTVAGYQTEFNALLGDTSDMTIVLKTQEELYSKTLNDYQTISTQYGLALQALAAASPSPEVDAYIAEVAKLQGDLTTAETSEESLKTGRLAPTQETLRATLSTLEGLVLGQPANLSLVTGEAVKTLEPDYLSTLGSYTSSLSTSTEDFKAYLPTYEAASTAFAADPATEAAFRATETMLDSLSTMMRTFAASAEGATSDYFTQISSAVTVAEGPYISTLAEVRDAYSTLVNTEIDLNSQLADYDTQEMTLTSSIAGYRALISSLSTGASIDTTALRDLEISSFALQETLGLTRSTLTSMQALSTAKVMSIAFYMSTFSTWTGQEDALTSSIMGYTVARDTLTEDILKLSQDIYDYTVSSFSEVITLKQNSDDFYKNKSKSLVEATEESRLAAAEFNAFTGALTAEFLIQKLNLYAILDGLQFKLSTDTGNTALQAEITNISGRQQTLQTLIDTLNPLEVDFAELNTMFIAEQTAKAAFVAKRKEITDIDIAILETPGLKAGLAASYARLWADLENLRTTVNSCIEARTTKLAQIYAKYDPVVPTIRQLSPTTMFPGRVPLDSRPIPYQSNDPNQSVTSLSEFAVMPPTQF